MSERICAYCRTPIGPLDASWFLGPDYELHAACGQHVALEDAPCTHDQGGVMTTQGNAASNRATPASACARCGRNPAAGYASITTVSGEKWYCHGEAGPPSCYEREQWDHAQVDQTVSRFLAALRAEVSP